MYVNIYMCVYVYMYARKNISNYKPFKLQTLINQNLIEYPLTRPYAKHVHKK